MLAAAALVMFMTPGLGFFYAGFTRSKNVLATIMQSFIVVGLVGVLVVLEEMVVLVGEHALDQMGPGRRMGAGIAL